jgi:hypothetical protein
MADEAWFARHPRRRHRIRAATKLDIVDSNVLGAMRPSDRALTVVKRAGPKLYVHLCFPWNGRVGDSEATAQFIWDTVFSAMRGGRR